MEDLIKALRNIGLTLPDHDQLLELSDPDPDVQINLARHLALPSSIDISDDLDTSSVTSDSDASSTLSQDPLVEADLFTGAVQALLENYNKSIDKERDALRNEFEQLSAPKKIKAIPLKALLARQSAEIKRRHEEVSAAKHDANSGQQLQNVYLPRQTFDGLGSYASSKGLADLTRIDFDQLQAPCRFEGRYILCKVASSLSLYVACTFIALLPSGQAIPVSIAHFTSNLHLSGSELDDRLPIGTILAIREPYVSLNHYAKGGHCQGGKNVIGIRVDTPTDVHILDGLGQADDQLMTDIVWQAELKDSGCYYFNSPSDVLEPFPVQVHRQGCRWLQDGPLSRIMKSGKNLNAQSIDRAKIRQRAHKLCRSFLAENRAGAAHRELTSLRYLGLAGLDFIDIAEDLELEALILHHMCRFEEARAAYEAALQAYPAQTREIAQERIYEMLNLARSAQKASALGPTHENVWSYYFDSDTYITPRFDLQDWMGPLSIKDVPGAGRGFVLTRDVEEGELLLCCKAAASSYALDPGCKGIHLLRYTVHNGVTSTTTQVLAATKAIHAMIDRPSDLTVRIMGLTAGPGVELSEWVGQPYPEPLKRSFTPEARRDHAALLRSLQEPDEQLKIQWHSLLVQNSDRPNINSDYVDGVLRFNAFGPSANPGSHSSSNSASAVASSEMYRSTMVHPLPAIINHGCESNTTSVFFGDIVTTRARHPLKKGTEIVHQYVKGEQPWPIRRAQLSKHAFKCHCGICQLDEADGEINVMLRNTLVLGSLPMLEDRSRILLKSDHPNLDEHKDLVISLEELVNKVQSTYHAFRSALRPDLVKIYQLLSLHQSQYDTDLAVQTELKALNASGATLSSSASDRVLITLPRLNLDASIVSMLTLARLKMQKRAADFETAQLWAKQAYYTHQCTIGGGADIFLDCWAGPFSDLPLRQWLPKS